MLLATAIGVMLVELTLELVCIDMSVDLSRSYVALPQQLLNYTEIRPTLKKMSGKAVSKGMDLGILSAISAIRLEPLPYQCPGKPLTPPSNEQEPASGIVIHQHWPAFNHIP